MLRRPPRSTLFPYTTPSDLIQLRCGGTGRSYREPSKRSCCACSLRVPKSVTDRKSTRLNSSHSQISYAVFCLKKKTHGDDVIDVFMCIPDVALPLHVITQLA